MLSCAKVNIIFGKENTNEQYFFAKVVFLFEKGGMARENVVTSQREWHDFHIERATCPESADSFPVALLVLESCSRRFLCGSPDCCVPCSLHLQPVHHARAVDRQAFRATGRRRGITKRHANAVDIHPCWSLCRYRKADGSH